jgi:transposase
MSQPSTCPPQNLTALTALQKRQLAASVRAVVGVDAGKFAHTLVVRPADGADSKPVSVPVTREGFEKAVSAIRAAVPGAAPADVLVGVEFAGSYGFTLAHYLHAHGFRVVSVLAAHTKRWKEITHRQPLKTDAKDALGICDLAAQGHFVSFPFLAPAYAELRYLLSAREKLSALRRGAITRLHTALDVIFPEFPALFASPVKPTARALLREFPGPDALRHAPKRAVLAVLRRESRNHLGAETYARLVDAATHTVALPSAQGVPKDELPLLIARLDLYETQMQTLEGAMGERLAGLPAARALLTIPNVAPVSAAVFLGSIGDPKAYDSSRQILALAGFTLVERSSGIVKGEKRISKRGRPVLRKHAHMFAVRSVHKGGIFRRPYEALLARNGRRPFAALTAIARKGLKLFYAVARTERPWTPDTPGTEGLAKPASECSRRASVVCSIERTCTTGGPGTQSPRSRRCGEESEAFPSETSHTRSAPPASGARSSLPQRGFEGSRSSAVIERLPRTFRIALRAPRSGLCLIDKRWQAPSLQARTERASRTRHEAPGASVGSGRDADGVRHARGRRQGPGGSPVDPDAAQ